MLTDDLRTAFKQFLMECELKVEETMGHVRVELSHRNIPLIVGSNTTEGFWEARRMQQDALKRELEEEGDTTLVTFGIEAPTGMTTNAIRDRFLEVLNEPDPYAVEDETFQWVSPLKTITDQESGKTVQRGVASVEVEWDLARKIRKAHPGFFCEKGGVEAIMLTVE